MLDKIGSLVIVDVQIYGLSVYNIVYMYKCVCVCVSVHTIW